MKKKNLKNLALLGLAGGTMMANQVEAGYNAAPVNMGGYSNLLAAGCGSSCHGITPSNNNPPANQVAYQNYRTNNGTYPSHNSNQQAANNPNNIPTQNAPQSGCATANQPMRTGQAQQPTNPNQGCSAMSPRAQPTQMGYSGCATVRYMADNSCHGYSPQQAGNSQWSQPTNSYASGCAAQRPPVQGNPQTNQPANTYASGCAAQRPPVQGNPPKNEQAYNYRANPNTNRNLNNKQTITSWDPQSSPNYYFQDQPYQTPVANQQGNNNSQNNQTGNYKDQAATRPIRPQLNESQLINLLSPEGLAIYNNLDPAGKALALKLVNMTCKGSNDCNGLNACKTEKNACAGKGAQGSTLGPFKDVNSAVKIASKKMSEKRSNAVNN